MGIVDDLSGLLDTTVTWYPFSSRDAYGVPTYGDGTSYDARIVRKHTKVVNAAGEEVVSKAQVWLAGTPAVATADKVLLDDGTYPPIIAVERYADADGATHTKVFF